MPKEGKFTFRIFIAPTFGPTDEKVAMTGASDPVFTKFPIAPPAFLTMSKKKRK